MEDVRSLMQATYPLQRAAIYDGTVVSTLLEECHFLFYTIGIELHFLELFDDALQDTIKAAYTN